MRYAIKGKGEPVMAYELGAGADIERQLIREGVIRPDGEGRYMLFSREAVNGVGEAAKAGDFFKVDEVGGRRYAYPNGREWFLAHHRHIRGDEYEQIARPVMVWLAGDPVEEEIRWLLERDRLRVTPGDDARYFHAVLWGAPLTAARDAAVVIYAVERDAGGHIARVDFALVDRSAFEDKYVYCDAGGNPVAAKGQEP